MVLFMVCRLLGAARRPEITLSSPLALRHRDNSLDITGKIPNTGMLYIFMLTSFFTFCRFYE